VFHLDCIQRWLKARSVCPLCNKEWDFAKIERIPGYGAVA
jgi:RING-box protein 1